MDVELDANPDPLCPPLPQPTSSIAESPSALTAIR